MSVRSVYCFTTIQLLLKWSRFSNRLSLLLSSSAVLDVAAVRSRRARLPRLDQPVRYAHQLERGHGLHGQQHGRPTAARSGTRGSAQFDGRRERHRRRNDYRA